MKVGSIPQITMLIQNEKMVERVLGNPKWYAWHFILHFTSSWYNATLLITSTAITRQNFQLNKNFSFTIHISDPSSRVFFHLPDVYTFKHSLFCSKHSQFYLKKVFILFSLLKARLWYILSVHRFISVLWKYYFTAF